MDPYNSIADYYDLEHAGFDADIDFYLNLLDAGPVLEIGAGTGRIMRPLLERGLEVWGIDSSATMIERAGWTLSELSGWNLREMSVLDLRLDREFKVILFSLNVLWHLTSPDDQRQALKLAADHLLPDGLILIDLSNPVSMADRGGNGELRVRYRGSRGDHPVTGMSAAWDDEAEQLLRLELMYDEPDPSGRVLRTQTDLTLRYTFRSELELMFRLAGLEPTHVYGSYDLDTYDSSSPRLIMLGTTQTR